MDTVKKTNTASTLPLYTISEEIANSVLHGVGALAATAGLVLLTVKTLGFLGGKRTGNLDLIAVLLFTATMIAMFLISTLYHAIQHQVAKKVLRRLDHSVIFIFIAGTYSPFCLSALKGTWGWTLFAIEWSLAITGIILNIIGWKILKKIEVAVYIIMGWAIIAGSVPLVRAVPVQSVILLISGGIAYTIGAVLYRMKNIKFNHAIWHVFVLIGTVCHWFSIWYII